MSPCNSSLYNSCSNTSAEPARTRGITRREMIAGASAAIIAGGAALASLGSMRETALAEEAPVAEAPQAGAPVAQPGVYFPTDGVFASPTELEISEEERIDYVTRNSLPPLRRMPAEEAAVLVDGLRMMRRAANLGLTAESCMYPEREWKTVYSRVFVERPAKPRVQFDGTLASELNAFIQSQAGVAVVVSAPELALDVPVVAKSGVDIFANPDTGTRVTNAPGADPVPEATFELVNCMDVELSGFAIDATRFGIYCESIKHCSIHHNTLTNIERRGLVLSNVVDTMVYANRFDVNRLGGIFVDRDTYDVVIASNTVTNSDNTHNIYSGITVRCGRDYVYELSEDRIYDTSQSIEDRLHAPHDVVLFGNVVNENRGTGMLLDGTYKIYIIRNDFIGNEKEGVCIDLGCIGTFLSQNLITNNGYRGRQTDQELMDDFIFNFGRNEDGSSAAKLPGVSFDNMLWLIATRNAVSNNYLGGFKSVRTTAQNIFHNNVIENNNLSAVHFSTQDPVDPAFAATAEIDFVHNYENIVADNQVSGTHESAVRIAPEDCYNDTLRNSITGCWVTPYENYSELVNSYYDNYIY